MIDRERIQALLPHRGPMLLVDQVPELVAEHMLCAVKVVTPGEACDAGALPFVLMLESACQAAAVLWLHSRGRLSSGEVLLFAAASDVTVRGRAFPGDVLCHRMRLDRVTRRVAFASGHTSVHDRVIAEFGSLAMTVRSFA